MLQNTSLLPLLLETAVEAGQKIMEIYNSNNLHVQQKADASPVTQADLEAHKIILEKLSATRIPILSEEGAKIPYEERKYWSDLWIVDPLDGTKEFIKRNGEFTVNIARVHQTQPVLGVVYVPVTQTLYYGGAGMGAFKQIGSEPPLLLKRNLQSSQTIRVAVSRSHVNKSTRDYIDHLPDAVAVPMGSSLKFMKLADGEIDLYPRFGPCMEWDTAAAHAILKGMGIEVINMENHLPLKYNKKSLYNPHFIVDPKGI